MRLSYKDVSIKFSYKNIVILTVLTRLKHIQSKGIESFGRTVGTPLDFSPTLQDLRTLLAVLPLDHPVAAGPGRPAAGPPPITGLLTEPAQPAHSRRVGLRVGVHVLRSVSTPQDEGIWRLRGPWRVGDGEWQLVVEELHQALGARQVVEVCGGQALHPGVPAGGSEDGAYAANLQIKKRTYSL